MPGQQLVQDDAERVDVRRRRGLIAPGLLRAEVVDRAEGRPRQRHLGLGDRPGDPEIRHLDPAIPVDHDVARLHVAMDDPALVGGVEGPGRLRGDPCRLARRQRPAPFDDRGEVLAVDQLHDDERPGGVMPVVVDRDDVRVVQRRRGLGFVAEPRAEVGVATVLRAEDLDGDVTVELVVVAAIDPGHPALAEQLREPVAAAEDRPDLRQVSLRHLGSWRSPGGGSVRLPAVTRRSDPSAPRPADAFAGPPPTSAPTPPRGWQARRRSQPPRAPPWRAPCRVHARPWAAAPAWRDSRTAVQGSARIRAPDVESGRRSRVGVSEVRLT